MGIRDEIYESGKGRGMEKRETKIRD